MLLGAVGCQSSSQPAPGGTEGTPAVEKPIELRFTTVVTTLHPNYRAWSQVADEVNKRTNGKVKITLYPSGTLNAPNETFNAVKSGLADIGGAPVGYSATIMPLNKLVGDAMLGVPSASEAAKIWSEAFASLPELQQEFEGVHLLWMAATTPLCLGTRDKKIGKLEDLRGLTLRFPPGLEPLAKKWGANPVNMPIADIYEALQKGTVQGFYGGAEMLQSMRLAELTKYAVGNLNMVYGLSWIGMNNKTWESLPPDVQQVFNDIRDWAQEVTVAAFDQSEREAREFAAAQGCEMVELDSAEVQRIHEVSRPVFRQIAETLEGQGKPAKKVLEALDQLLAKHGYK
jgi:TRAP-type C4-dicarboxylate transport system substrate-binding protein